MNRRHFLLLTAALLTACGKKAPKHSALPRGSAVLALGDSLTYGYGANPTESYPARLAELTGWAITNGGVSGDTSAQALARLPERRTSSSSALAATTSSAASRKTKPAPTSAPSSRPAKLRARKPSSSACLASALAQRLATPATTRSTQTSPRQKTSLTTPTAGRKSWAKMPSNPTKSTPTPPDTLNLPAALPRT